MVVEEFIEASFAVFLVLVWSEGTLLHLLFLVLLFYSLLILLSLIILPDESLTKRLLLRSRDLLLLKTNITQLYHLIYLFFIVEEIDFGFLRSCLFLEDFLGYLGEFGHVLCVCG